MAKKASLRTVHKKLNSMDAQVDYQRVGNKMKISKAFI